MQCWGELKSLRAQSVGEVMRAIFRICGNESQPGLQLVEKLATTLPKTCYAYPDEDEAIPKIELKH